MLKNFILSVLCGAALAVGMIYLYSDGSEYTMDYYVELHEWDKKLSPCGRLLTKLPYFTPAQAIRAEEQWRVFGIRTSQARFIERWPQEDDWRFVCYRLSFIDSSARLFFWTPKYYDDEKYGIAVKTRYNEKQPVGF